MGEWTWRGFKVVQSLVERLPRSWAYALAVMAARLAWRFSPLARPRLEYNLKIACPELRDDPVALRRLSRLNFQNHAKAYADLMQLPSARIEAMRPLLKVTGLENLDAARSHGRGVIMAVPHMGSWDMAGSYAGALGYRISAVAERFPGSLNDAVVATRERFGLNVITVGRAAVRGINEALAANHVVALLCDLEQGPGLSVNFFGRRATVPGGPAAFALKTGAALLPACQYATAAGRYHVHLDPALAAHEGDTKETLMQRVIGRFEDFIKERPDQWYAFRPMFSR
ncbi:MAG: hypothetical protein E6I41_04340 [Chloroflexi bacterium]|nr:MAG: hypothetical protein E6I41_04340 [Chloroflexota bacterium]